MLKRIAALALSAALLTGSAAAVAPEEAFPAVHTYPGFIDVAEGAWYAGAARVCCEVGLMQGTGQAFAPDQVLTVGEVAAIAARMNQAVTGDALPGAGPGQPWYAPYVACLEGLGVAVPDPEKAASRQEFVSLLAAVVPEDMLSPVNTVASLPDTGDTDVLAFYGAGILTGVDAWGTFAGDKTLTRAECAAMAARIARPELRETFTPADYAIFTAAGMKPYDPVFSWVSGYVPARDYLDCVLGLIQELEDLCASEGVEFNWFNTYGDQTFLDYVDTMSMIRLGVAESMGTSYYEQFDVQVFYSRYLDLKGA